MPTDGPPLPDPKARTLARGPRRYRRKVASPKQWQAIVAAKQGPCRVCVEALRNGGLHARSPLIAFHHVVARDHFGDDSEDNIVPVCALHHEDLHLRSPWAGEKLLRSLSDAEYAYMIQRGGEGYPERAYGVRYAR